MFNFTLLAQGYQITILQPADLPEVMALQALVHNKLGADQKSFITPKTTAQFTARMTERGAMCGVRTMDTGRLVGYGNLVLPSITWPKADMALSYEAVPYDYDAYAVLQSCVVHPDYRRKGLGAHIIRAHELVCSQQGRGHMMAEVVLQNLPSLKGFLSCGYQVSHATIDPADGADLLYVGKDLMQQAEPVQAEGMIDVPLHFKKVSALLATGYRGVGIRSEAEQLYLRMRPQTPTESQLQEGDCARLAVCNL